MVGVMLWCTSAGAQDLDYRISAVDEATAWHLNSATPYNAGNLVLPQPVRGNTGTLNAALGFGVVSTSLGFTAVSSDIQRPDYRFDIRELSVDLSLGESWDLLLGKKILKWGTGYAFNPTGVVEPQRSPSDPGDRLNQNEGRNLVSLTGFIGKSSLTAVYLNDAEVAHSSLAWGKNEIALRAYTFIGGLDLSLVGHYREGDRLEIGANTSYVIGDNLELHGELLGKRGSSMLYHAILRSDNPAQEFTAFPYAATEDDSREIFCKLLAGGQFTFTNGINVALEYYHNQEGLSPGEWKRWMNFVKFQDAIQRGAIAVDPAMIVPSRLNLLWSLLTLSPRGTMRDYLFLRAAYSEVSWSCEAICFMNAADGSVALIPTLTWKASAYLSVYARYSGYLGRNDAEFGSLFATSALGLGIGVQL
ncbi:MAG TPA: hypothetical protein VMM80_00515 [Bacteroidota bacterium]|nr:hypothetical protein [Bacteroidota bacterium]